MGNASVMALSLLNLALRFFSRVGGVLPWGLALSLVVGIILLIKGWMGGELSYRYSEELAPARSNRGPAG